MSNESIKSHDVLKCDKYRLGLCHSCQFIEMPYPEQLDQKQNRLRQALATRLDESSEVLLPMSSEISAFRYKAKMVVSGAVERVNLGLVNDELEGVDLTDCPLYPDSIKTKFGLIKQYIQQVGLVPYQIKTKKGILKYILLTQSHATGELMIRFVVKDTSKLEKMQAHLSTLTNDDAIKVVSVNIQPIHQAILEGEEEIILTPQARIAERFNDITLYIQPKSFFQTHPILAEKLYATAAEWACQYPATKIWDLFCGVGGFGLHVVSSLEKKYQTEISLVGIEIEPNAIESAKQSAALLGLNAVSFEALDSTLFAAQTVQVPELLIVNPPRRGLGSELAQAIDRLETKTIIYSSCHVDSLAQDLIVLQTFQVTKVQLFDFFPHTAHFEVLVLLEKKPLNFD